VGDVVSTLGRLLVASVSKAGVEIDGLAEQFLGFGRLALDAPQRAEVAVGGGGIGGIQVDGLAEVVKLLRVGQFPLPRK
jgi:hypothetical protein